MGIPAKNQGKFAIVNTLLNTTDSTVLEQLNGRQGDNGRVAYFAMKDGNLPHDISNQTVVITIKDAAGKIKRISGVTDIISATGGLFEMTIPAELYQAAGDTEEAYMSVEDNTGVVISTIPIQFNVLENNIMFTANGSKDYIDSVQKMIDKIESKLKPLADKIGIEDKALELLKKELADLEAKIDSKDVAMLHEDNVFTKRNTMQGPFIIQDPVSDVARLYMQSNGVNYAMLQMTKGSTPYSNVGLAGTDGSMILGGGEGTSVLFDDLAKNGVASGTVLSSLKSGSEQGAIGGDTIVRIMTNMNAYQSSKYDDVYSFDFGYDGSIERVGKDGKITIMDSSGMLVGKAHPIAANADLNDIRTSGLYDSGPSTNAGTIKNGITNPSSQKGTSFILSVEVNKGGTIIQQDLKTYKGWAFTRTLYLAGSSPVVTPWIAYAGTMTQTIAGPNNSKINLLRSGNQVQARLLGDSASIIVKAGATTTQKVPLDYVPQFTREGVANMPEAMINTLYDTQSVTVLKDGSMKNFGGGDFKGTGVGNWLIIG